MDHCVWEVVDSVGADGSAAVVSVLVVAVGPSAVTVSGVVSVASAWVSGVVSVSSALVSVVLVLSAELEVELELFNRLNRKAVVPVTPGNAYEGRAYEGRLYEARKGKAARRNSLGSILAGAR